MSDLKIGDVVWVEDEIAKGEVVKIVSQVYSALPRAIGVKLLEEGIYLPKGDTGWFYENMLIRLEGGDSVDEHNQERFADEMEFWMVWNPADRAPRYKHHTLGDAEKEAERLATKHPGQKFYVLRAISVSVVPKPVKTKELKPYHPF